MSERQRILIVDDDRDIAFGAGLRLRAAGYEILTACDGREGIDSARENRPDAILLDVRMPRLDGLRALDELKSGADTCCIPVVMLSASMRDRHSALDHGARFFLSKPFQNADLLAAVRTALREKGRAPAESPLQDP
jgi:DNA-binding response OmpR family regulator